VHAMHCMMGRARLPAISWIPVLLVVWVYKARDAYGCKFPACLLNLAEVHNSAKIQDSGTEPEFRYLVGTRTGTGQNLEFQQHPPRYVIYICIYLRGFCYLLVRNGRDKGLCIHASAPGCTNRLTPVREHFTRFVHSGAEA